MRKSKITLCRRGAFLMEFVLVAVLTGCGDFSQRYLGGIREEARAEGPPRAAPPLAIPNAPLAAQGPQAPGDPSVKPAAFNVPREIPPALIEPANSNGVMQHPMRVVYQRAAQQVNAMDSYIFRLKRREKSAGVQKPEEILQIKLRREPYSVYLKWLSEEGKGREVLYVRGKYEDKMQTVLAANDAFPFSPAGMRFSISPDDKLARAKSRYPITDTGFASLVGRFGKLVAAVERGDMSQGSAKYLGRLSRAEFTTPVEAVHQVLPAGTDPALPRGGQRWWYFDAARGWPVLIIAHDADGEVEYYCHDHIQWPVNLDEADFNPDWLKRK